jgi:protein TonB
MVVSLGGPVGAPTGGMRGLADRPVQQAEPKPELPKPQPVRPPAAKTPEVVEPTVKPTPPRPTQRQSSRSNRPAPPTTGEAVRPGSARVETGTQSTEAGLSTGGGGSGAADTLANFCDPQYLGQMIALIHRNWPNQRQAVAARPIIRFVIQRDGTLTDIAIRQSSGYYALDLGAKRAVDLTRAVPPLPSCYPHSDFAVNLTFEYIR